MHKKISDTIDIAVLEDIQSVLSALIEKEILSKNGKYQFQNAMLKKWIQRIS
jgi:hypothetical protein